MSTKVLWFSRHEITPDQRAALGDSEIIQVDKTIKHASELEDEINQCDVLAVVAPTELQKEFLELAGDKPVITALHDRILVPTENGESKAQFNFVKWEQVKKIDIAKEDFDIGKYKRMEELENLKEFTLTRDNLADCVDAVTGQPIPTEGNVVLPEKVIYQGEEYKLTGIGKEAFYCCRKLTSVNIPDSVTRIGNRAFYDCESLESVTLRDGLKTIGEGAFLGCESLTSVNIPDSVVKIGNRVFDECEKLTSISIPKYLKTLGKEAFDRCYSFAFRHYSEYDRRFWIRGI